MRVSTTRRFFFGGSGTLSCPSLLSTGVAGVVSPALARGPDSGMERESFSGTTVFAGVKARFDDIRGDRDGGRETVDSAGVVDGVSVEDDVRGTQ